MAPCRKAKQVLIFNRHKKLSGISASKYEAAKITGLSPSNISQACTGTLIATGGFYFRYIDNSIIIELSDIGTLRLEDYDKMCGVDRILYPTASMSRKGIKFLKNKMYGN